MTRRRIAAWVAGAVLVSGVGGAGIAVTSTLLDLPPSDGVALSGILQAMERRGMGFLQSVEYERDWWQLTGYWEITVCKEQCIKHYVDPRTGEEHRRDSADPEEALPVADIKGPSAIAKELAQRRLVVQEIEYEHGAWQVKYRESRSVFNALKPAERRTFEQVSFHRKPAGPRRNLPAPPRNAI